MSLPTYEQATTKPDPWRVIAHHLPDSLLTTLCLVSKHFYEIFGPRIWCNPTRWMLFKENPYLEFNDFVRAVPIRSLRVRRFPVMMDFRPLQEANSSVDRNPRDYYSNLDSVARLYSTRWFLTIATSFPSLKFLIMDGLTGFDTQGITLRDPRTESPSISQRLLNGDPGGVFFPHLHPDLPRDHEQVFPHQSFYPVLLSASGCAQLDSTCLGFQSYATKLLYLDVSWTKYRPDLAALTNLRHLQHLKILKLRGLGLKKEDIAPLLEKIGVWLFSLDLRDNNFTDDVIPKLLAHSFLSPLEQPANLRPEIDEEGRLASHTSSSSRCASPERYLEEAPAYRERVDPTEEQESVILDGRVDMREDDVESVISYLCGGDQIRSIQNPCGLPPAEDDFMQRTGLTHLYLSGNRFTSDALSNLLMGTNRLQLLDFGSAVQSQHRLSAKNPNLRPMCQPDTVKLLCPAVSQRLDTLRVHHSIVTHTPTLCTVGEFHPSESQRVRVSEEEYAPEEFIFWPAEFLPDINPRIRCLTLTHVPQKSFGLVIKRLLKFIRAAAIQESLIAKATPLNTRRGARMLSGLRVLTLEFAPDPVSRRRPTTGVSVSGDADADAFIEESIKDFSFFDERTESPESSVKDFSFFDNEKPTARTLSVSSVASSQKVEMKNARLRDVREELGAYRERTRKAYEAERERLGGAGVRVPLGAPHYYWTGHLELVS